MSQSVRNNGELRVCCHSNQGPGRGILSREGGAPYNVVDADLNEARNAPLLKNVRSHMLKGQWHPACVRCQREERAGLRSRRIYENEIWSEHVDTAQLQEATALDGHLNPSASPTYYMDIRFGNKCNLSCRSCGPTDSSAWYRDHVAVWGAGFEESSQKIELVKQGGRYLPSPNPYDWHESSTFWQQMSDRSGEIRHLYLVGGEPLLIERHYEFLEECVRKGVSDNIILEYNSNITTLPDRVWDLWAQFKQVKIGASIDGVGALNDYIRYPSRWDKIEANLKRLSQAPKNIKVWWAATVMIYNIYSLPDIMKWVIAQNFHSVNDKRWQPILTPHPLHRPFYLSAQALPLDVKERVAQKFQEELPAIEQTILNSAHTETRKQAMLKNAPKLLDQYKRFMYQEDRTSELRLFWFYTKRLDEVRGQSFEQACPELAELLSGHKPAVIEAPL